MQKCDGEKLMNEKKSMYIMVLKMHTVGQI